MERSIDFRGRQKALRGLVFWCQASSTCISYQFRRLHSQHRLGQELAEAPVSLVYGLGCLQPK